MANPQQISRINDVLHEIHRDISADHTGKKLAQVAAFTEQHFHRTFKKVVGEPVHQYIRRVRLEHAANQLMFDPYRPVLEVAEKCGFASLSSFSRAFKQTFGNPPGQWRGKEHSSQIPSFLQDKEIAAAQKRSQNNPLPKVNLIELPAQQVAYVRHQGYGRSIRNAWQTLQAWASLENRPFDFQLGLHHSNPVWVPLEQCRYVACLAIDKPILKRGLVNSMTIPGGIHAAFDLTGQYGELIPFISKIQDQWLPTSGFRANTTPAFVRYRRNQFLSEDERFELTFYLPISAW